ncbi:hypothetical protein [Virgibacillus sp. 6R]|nr:hypothetical protein [Virgibacillus sp. 6R]
MYAQSEVTERIRSRPEYRFMTEAQVRESLGNLGLSDEEVNIGIGYWKEVKKGDQKQFNSFLERIDYNFADSKNNQANNYLLLNELYFSETVLSKAKGLQKSIFEILVYKDPSLKHSSIGEEIKEGRLVIQKARDKIEKGVPELKEMMKKELKEG